MLDWKCTCGLWKISHDFRFFKRSQPFFPPFYFQGLLNIFFSDWATKDIRLHLPFIYNVISQAFYSYPPAFIHFRNTIRVVHFIGSEKPWHCELDKFGQVIVRDPTSVGTPEFLQHWWNLFMTHVHPKLTPGEVSELLMNTSLNTPLLNQI